MNWRFLILGLIWTFVAGVSWRRLHSPQAAPHTRTAATIATIVAVGFYVIAVTT